MAATELPFLYHTRTLLRWSAPCRRFPRWPRALPASIRCQSTTEDSQAYKYPGGRLDGSHTWQAKQTAQSNTSNTLEDGEEEASSFLQEKARQVRAKAMSSPPSILTPQERAVFERLGRESPDEDAALEDEALQENEYTKHDDILAIFTRSVLQSEIAESPPARQPLRHEDEDGRPSSDEQLSPRDDFFVELDMQNEDPGDSKEAEHAERVLRIHLKREFRRIALALDHAATGSKDATMGEQVWSARLAGDHSIWQVLHTLVFPMLQLLEVKADTTKEIQRVSSASPPTDVLQEARRADSSLHSLTAVLSDSTSRELSSPFNSVSISTSTSASSSSISHQPPEDPVSSPSPSSSPLPISREILPLFSVGVSPLALVSRLYPATLLLALRLLVKHSPTSPYITALLPEIRSRGPRSYVLGATTAFYNTLLRHQWDVYSDLGAIDTTLAEMQKNGVEFDAGTFEAISTVAEDRARDFEVHERRLVQGGDVEGPAFQPESRDGNRAVGDESQNPAQNQDRNQHRMGASAPSMNSSSSSRSLGATLRKGARDKTWWDRPTQQMLFNRVVRDWRPVIASRLE